MLPVRRRPDAWQAHWLPRCQKGRIAMIKGRNARRIEGVCRTDDGSAGAEGNHRSRGKKDRYGRENSSAAGTGTITAFGCLYVPQANMLCFRYNQSDLEKLDDLDRQIRHAYNGSGRGWISGTTRVERPLLRPSAVKHPREHMVQTTDRIALATGKFFGAIVRQRTTPALSLTETRYERIGSLPSHVHERPTFFLPLAGTFHVAIGDDTTTCRRLSASYHGVDAPHAVHVRTVGARGLNVELTDERFLPWLEPGASVVGVGVGGALMPHLLTRLYAELRSPDDVSDIAAEGLALELVAAVRRLRVRATEPGRAPVDQLLALLEEQPNAPDPLATVATKWGLEAHQLARAVRRHTGRSIGSLVRAARVRASCARVAGSEEPLSVIAADLGFFDHAHFTRAFTQIVGLTPSAYRKRCARG